MDYLYEIFLKLKMGFDFFGIKENTDLYWDLGIIIKIKNMIFSFPSEINLEFPNYQHYQLFIYESEKDFEKGLSRMIINFELSEELNKDIEDIKERIRKYL